ncbi:TIM barrel protein [Alkalibaculum sp. M08DMB]|uniref:TIM barrel protein n=1 Tax=Alkalibaculum sporogenes TaxID=2655001 RepID=A0A6A7KB74_9FIRM|nr:TIM barrel protein [Alkalibaculum sporogenes]MPW26605.1 TIM barrel protein [Alkalibaculum sporogenes]
MKKCIFSWFGFIIPLPERLRLIKESNFDATCLWWEDETYPKIIKVDDMPNIVRDNGLSIDNIHCPYKDINKLWSHHKSERESVVDTYYKYIDACTKHNISNMVMHVTDEGFICERTSLGVESFLLLAKRAEENGINIAIENTRDMDIVDHILTEIKSNHLGLCYDSSHDWIYGQSEGELLEKWKHRLFCTHLSDNDRLDDRHWIVGDGEIVWDKIIANIINADIDYITMELMSSKEQISDPKIFLNTAYSRLDYIMGNCQ